MREKRKKMAQEKKVKMTKLKQEDKKILEQAFLFKDSI